jgi:VWFA-related protein
MTPCPRVLLRLLAVAVLAAGTGGTLAAGDGQTTSQPPRFRGGTNLVRLDVYASANGQAVTDLTRDDFEVYEDNAPQVIDQFEVVPRRTVTPGTARPEPESPQEADRLAGQPGTRAFVLFLDPMHVQLGGSVRAGNPVGEMLERVIGADDLVGVMTTEMSARNLTFTRRVQRIEQMLKDNWVWGSRDRIGEVDPRETAIQLCYPDEGATAGWARAVVERRREKQTLDAVEDLITHLEGIRQDRTFVLVLSEGWTLPPRDEGLARPYRSPSGSTRVPGRPTPAGTGPDGRLASGEESLRADGFESCERERAMLALTDFQLEYRQLLQKANRANVSFYPVDPRGAVVFDDPIGPARPSTPTVDAARLRARQDHLRQLATETDGVAILNTTIDGPMQRLFEDTGTYYLLGYYSTNTKLDGRYRRLSVRVRREGVTVRARPGYLAPTESEVARARREASPVSAGGRATEAGGRPSGSAAIAGASIPPRSSAPPGSRGATPLYFAAAGGSGLIALTLELDAVAAKQPDWERGATARLEIVKGDTWPGTPIASEEIPLEAGQRVISLQRPVRELLDPGRYLVRMAVTPTGARTPVTLNQSVQVPAPTALVGSGVLAWRRGPGTGPGFVPTANARFRRVERLRLDVPLVAEGTTVTGTVLNRNGQAMTLPVTVSERLDESPPRRSAVAEVALAPLAQGEYVVELTATGGGRTDTVVYGFRIVP